MNVTIYVNVLYNKNSKKIYPGYVSKYNSERKKQIKFFMIPGIEKMVLSRSNNYPHYLEE